MLAILDNLVLGGLVLAAIAISTMAQADPPQINSSGRHYTPPQIRVEALRPQATAPTIGFNPQYRPDLNAIQPDRRHGKGVP